MRYLFLLGLTDGGCFQKLPGPSVGQVGIIHRVQDAVRAEDIQNELEVRQGKHAARGHIHLVLERFRYRPFQSRNFFGQRGVQPVQEKRNHLSPMTGNDSQPRHSVEGPGNDEPEHLDARFVMPAPSVGGQSGRHDGIEAPVVDALNFPTGETGVQIQGHSQFASLGEHRHILRGIQEHGFFVGPADNQRTFEPERFDGALQFGGRGLRIRQRQRRECREPVRVPVDGGSQTIVGGTGELPVREGEIAGNR